MTYVPAAGVVFSCWWCLDTAFPSASSAVGVYDSLPSSSLQLGGHQSPGSEEQSMAVSCYII